MPETAGLIERGLRLERAGVLEEALRCYEEAVAAAETPAEQSEGLRRQADVLRIRCRWDESLALAHQSELIARSAGLSDFMAEAINAQAAVHQSRGTFDAARELYERVLEAAPRPRIRGIALQNLGAIAAMRGDHDEAANRFEASIDCFEEDGYERDVAIALNNLGRASLDQHDFRRAERVLERAVGAARRLEDLELTAVGLVNRAEALLGLGDNARAEREASEALGFFKVSENRWRQVECLRVLGDVHRARGEPGVALRLYQQALATAEEIDAGPEAELLRGRIATTELAETG